MLELNIELKIDKGMPALPQLIRVSQDLRSFNKVSSLIKREMYKDIEERVLELMNNCKLDLQYLLETKTEGQLRSNISTIVPELYPQINREEILNLMFKDKDYRPLYTILDILSVIAYSDMYTYEQIEKNLLTKEMKIKFLEKTTPIAKASPKLKEAILPLFEGSVFSTITDASYLMDLFFRAMGKWVNGIVPWSDLSSDFNQEIYSQMNLGNEDEYYGSEDEDYELPEYSDEEIMFEEALLLTALVASDEIPSEEVYDKMEELFIFAINHLNSYEKKNPLFMSGLPFTNTRETDYELKTFESKEAILSIINMCNNTNHIANKVSHWGEYRRLNAILSDHFKLKLMLGEYNDKIGGDTHLQFIGYYYDYVKSRTYGSYYTDRDKNKMFEEEIVPMLISKNPEVEQVIFEYKLK